MTKRCSKMSDVDKVIAGLTLFRDRYGCSEVAADHECIYGGPDPEEVSDEDRASLEALGWLPNDHDEWFCFFV